MYSSIIQNILQKDSFIEKVHVSVFDNHYRIIVIDQKFFGKSKLDRHKMIYSSISFLITSNKIHSLSIFAFCPEEWNDYRRVNKIESFKI